MTDEEGLAVGQFASVGDYALMRSNRDMPDYDPDTRAHLWCVASVYRVNPDTLNGDGPHILDSENLLSIQGPICYHCEQPYTAMYAARPCPGEVLAY